MGGESRCSSLVVTEEEASNVSDSCGSRPSYHQQRCSEVADHPGKSILASLHPAPATVARSCLDFCC